LPEGKRSCACFGFKKTGVKKGGGSGACGKARRQAALPPRKTPGCLSVSMRITYPEDAKWFDCDPDPAIKGTTVFFRTRKNIVIPAKTESIEWCNDWTKNAPRRKE
jgi:hypothetical protein